MTHPAAGSDPATLLAAQRAAFLRDGPPRLAQRRADLARLKRALLARRRDFEQAIDADFGHRPPLETALMEYVPLIQGIKYLHRHLRGLMRPQRRRVAPQFKPARAWVQHQPLGVVGVMSPWNFPLSLSLMPVATALAAGNRVMLKPSEMTPATSALLARMLNELFSPEQVSVVMGGPDTGAAFTALPFDHLVFTGSTGVGRQVMRAASDNLVPLTLELGGKSPVIIERGFSLPRAAKSLVYGKLSNAGQTCIAPDYALVHADDVEAFVKAYRNAVQAAYPRGAADPAYASIINVRHHERLQALLEDAAARGARIISIGAVADSAETRRLAPALVLDVTSDMQILQEEIFGPLLPVVSYRELDEAITYVNARPRPLALYLFSDRNRSILRVLKRTTSGGVTVNDTLLHYAQDNLPFGGIGASGMGAYHGEEGFRRLSHTKGVFRQSKRNTAGVARAPFGRLTGLALRWLLR